MNIITLIPIKNEDWVLEMSLENISKFSDLIIIADQNSTDRSLEICNKFPKVRMVKNNKVGHSNEVRWLLLDEARKIEGNNIIFCIDADEMVSPRIKEYLHNLIENGDLKPGEGISLKWIQIWDSINKHRVDGVWKSNIKEVGFYDDRRVDYLRKIVINDHTSRIPSTNRNIFIEDFPLLHIQSISLERHLVKQAWYRCNELIVNSKNAKKINHKYSVTSYESVKIERVNSEWLKDVNILNNAYFRNNDWRYNEILDWFNEYGVDFFEPLEIWQIKELRNYFIDKIGREPKSITFPRWLVFLNKLKNKIKNNF